jgi:hypothetical protein
LPWHYKAAVGPEGEFCFFEIGPRFEDAPEYINVVASTWHKDETINKHDAMLICEAVNSHDRLTAEVARLRDVLHSIHLRAELAEADGAHMRGALGNIKDDAAKALNPEEPK